MGYWLTWYDFVNELMVWDALIDSVWIEYTKLKYEFFLSMIFAAFCVPVVKG